MLAVRASQEAEALGASAVMSTPPAKSLSDSEVLAYFKAIDEAVNVPIVVQVMTEVPLSIDLLALLVREVPGVRYAKVENSPPGKSVAEAVAEIGDQLTIIGGASGSELIEELAAGSQGTMPHAARAGSFVRIWDQWHAGEHDAARETWQREIAPILAIGPAVHKELLRREGVIKHSHFRAPADHHLDAAALRQLDQVCEALGIG